MHAPTNRGRAWEPLLRVFDRWLENACFLLFTLRGTGRAMLVVRGGEGQGRVAKIFGLGDMHRYINMKAPAVGVKCTWAVRSLYIFLVVVQFLFRETIRKYLLKLNPYYV